MSQVRAEASAAPSRSCATARRRVPAGPAHGRRSGAPGASRQRFLLRMILASFQRPAPVNVCRVAGPRTGNSPPDADGGAGCCIFSYFRLRFAAVARQALRHCTPSPAQVSPSPNQANPRKCGRTRPRPRRSAGYPTISHARRTPACRQVRPLIEQGVEVVVPAGGLPMLLFAREREFSIDDAIKLRRLTSPAAMTRLV